MATSLALLSQAAEGRTFDELREGLHLNSSDKAAIANQFSNFSSQLKENVGDTMLSIANQIYIKQGRELNESFRQVATSKFRSGIDTLNFGDADKSADTINQFVEAKTLGKIRNFVKPNTLDANTALFLVNAIYFKGIWEQKFNKEDTHEDDFYNNGNEMAPANFMSATKRFNYARLPDLGASALEMNYANSTLSFLIILPFKRMGLPDLEAKLRDSAFSAIINQMHPRKIDVSIPKFKIDFEIELNAVLKRVGSFSMVFWRL